MKFACLIPCALLGFLPMSAPAAGNPVVPETGSVRIVVPADSVRFTVDIRTEQTVVDYQLYELGEARKRLVDAALQSGKLSVTLKTPETSFDDTSFNISSGRSSGDYPDVSVDLFYPIKEGFDLLACAREVNALVASLKIPENARYKYHIDAMTLWVAAPENSRPALLKLFAADMQAISAALGGKVKFNISNLSTPVRQRPVGDSRVELFLEPTVTLEVF